MNQARQPAGAPVGGQFAATPYPHADLALLAYEDPERAPGITEDDVDEFTGGSCAVLADALHERTGWPVVVVADVEGRLGSFHAGVRTPEGTILDVVGEHDDPDWVEDYGGWADSYGHDLMDEDPTYGYDGDCIQTCDATDHGWTEGGFKDQHDPELVERAHRLTDLLLDAREASTLPRPPGLEHPSQLPGGDR